MRFISHLCTNTGTLPASVIITLTHSTPSVNSDGLARRYDIEAIGGSDYEARLTLCYQHEELVQTGIPLTQESDLHAYRWTGSDWQEYSIVDIDNNTVTALDVRAFGIWGLGIPSDHPTAVTLRSFSAHRVSAETLWMVVTGVCLAGVALWWQAARHPKTVRR
jgi:hypothetical protein